VLAFVTAAAAVVSDGNAAVALAPCIAALLVWSIWKFPLRLPMLVLLALAWVLEIPGDAFASGRVRTPLHAIGAVLFAKLNGIVPIDALVVSGFDILLLLFAVVVIHRHATHSRVDRAAWLESPRPMRQLAVLSLVAVGWMMIMGLARGGSFRFSLWQVNRHLYLPLVYLLMAEALRGPIDAPAIGRIVLGVGVFRAAEAIILRQMNPSTDAFPHATTHHDSVLFVTCVAILLATLLEQPTKRGFKLFALLVPIYLWGMMANNRRLSWTELTMVVLFFFIITPWGRVKRSCARAVVISILPLAIYAAAGWNSQGGRLFGPVRTFRSLFDADVDSSTRWRDWENYDLVTTFTQNPVFGTGFGRPFTEAIKLPDVTRSYDLEPYIPHNSVLGLWAFGGLIGFALLWAIYPAGMFFTVRAYRWSRTSAERIAALGAAAVQICYLMQGYGDLGFGTWGPVFTVAAAYAIVGKICVANGAWPAGSPRQVR